MSIALITAAFKASLPSTAKFVLVALCDSANDQGECYPSVATLAVKCGIGERTVQDSLKAIEAAGGLRREFRKGRATVYWVTPANCQPPQLPHPSPAVAAPPQLPHPRGAVAAPAPAVAAPITVIEPNTNTKTKSAPASVPAAVLVEAGFDEATATEFIAHKCRVKAPLTELAWRDHLAESRKAGWTPKAAAEKVMARAWKGFEAKYVASEARPGADGETARERHTRERVRQMTGGILGNKPASMPAWIDAEIIERIA